MPVKISATIITLNEEDNLVRCLNSLKDVVDEIILVDSGSQDRTLEIAADYGARIFSRTWTNYSEQKNYAANQASADWILSIDADECVGPELKSEITALKSAGARADAYQFPRIAFYLGRWIKHSGWYPDYKTRLYLKNKATWQGSFVHESLRVNGAVSLLKGHLLHYTCNSLSEHLTRLDRYTTLAAKDLHSRGKSGGTIQLLFSPVLTFVKTYFLNSGFRDGAHGYLIACLASFYNFMKYAKLRELEKNPRMKPINGPRT
jgi:glycosyltransferase involved in cell wall biosynthesis